MIKHLSLLIFLFLFSLAGCSHAPLFNLSLPYTREVASDANNLCLKLASDLVSPTPVKTNLTLEERLFAVHLTDHAPANGIIEANSLERVRFASTIHFSLGEPVIAHNRGNWAEKKYAILLPIKYIKNQMVNVFVQDTFVLGSVELPKEAILILPKGESLPKGYVGKSIYYENQSIIDVTKEVIQKENGIKLDAKSAFVNLEINVDGEDLLAKEFLQQFFNENKHLSYDLHESTIYGALDVGVYYLFSNWFYGHSVSALSVSFLTEKLLLFKEFLKVIDQRSIEMSLSSTAKSNYEKNKKALQGLFNLIELEIRLQKEQQKTFLNYSSLLKSELWPNRHSPEKLESIVKDFSEQLKDFKPNSKVIFVHSFIKELKRFDLDYNTIKSALYNPELINSVDDVWSIHSELFSAGLKDYKLQKVSFDEIYNEFQLAMKSSKQSFQIYTLLQAVKISEVEGLLENLSKDPEIAKIIEDYYQQKIRENRTL